MLTVLSALWTIGSGSAAFYYATSHAIPETVFWSACMLMMFITTAINAHKGI